MIKCVQCDKPTRDHSLLGLCPDLAAILGTTRLTAPAPLTGRKKPEVEGNSKW